MKPIASVLLASCALSACTAQGGAYGSHASRRTYLRGPAPLVGGETDDNARLPEYLDYVAAYPHGDVPKLDLTDRRVVTVLGAGGVPLWDVGVGVEIPGRGVYRARTNAAGQFLLPPAALGIASGAVLRAALEDSQEDAVLLPHDDVLRFPSAPRRPPAYAGVDVALVVDTTGSMGDEIERLRSTLQAVVARIAAHPIGPRVRVGGVAYRDVGDAYVTRPFDFSPDLRGVQGVLDGLQAGGGGDGPEAVQEALETGVHRLSWGGPGTVRVMFLIGDAPPHLERGRPYTDTMRDAMERGIVVFPVACSGMDDTGEFVWRQIAAVTLGTFLFVSYGGGTENHVGPYVENDLDVLMVRAVGRLLDGLDGRAAPPPTVAPYAQPLPLPPPDAWAGDRIGWGRAPWDFGRGRPSR